LKRRGTQRKRGGKQSFSVQKLHYTCRQDTLNLHQICCAGGKVFDLSRDINSLSNFKRNTAEFMEQLKETKQPIVLTVNGKAELVVQDVESYQRLLETAELVDSIKGIRRALEQMKHGKSRPADQVIAELRQELGIPDE
jgi:prevent-host-death family protein